MIPNASDIRKAQARQRKRESVARKVRAQQTRYEDHGWQPTDQMLVKWRQQNER